MAITNPEQNSSWLVADVGATNSRCATLTAPEFELSAVRHFRNTDASSLQDVLLRYVAETESEFSSCALAIAAPIDGEKVRMINREWNFTGPEISRLLGLDRVSIMNDFHAVAYSLPHLNDNQRAEIGTATQYRSGNIAVLGPGSGLVMSAWIDDRRGGTAMAGEGGHVSVAGRNDTEDAIIAKLRERFGHCSAERVLSGPGLIALHHAMHDVKVRTSEEITTNKDDVRCAETLNQFFLFLGGVAADLALITGAFGGVYIAGGIVPTCIDAMRRSGFRARFEDKNRYTDYMRAIPTWVITDPCPGLTGLSVFVRQGS